MAMIGAVEPATLPRDNGPPARPPGVHGKAAWDIRRGVWIDGDYWFDEKTADRAVEFFAIYLCFSIGRWAGEPFILEPWEELDIIRPLFGWKRQDDMRRYRRCYLWVARKNGKTELAAGVALLMLLFDREEGGEVYSIATGKDQATIVFDRAKKMVKKSQWLKRDVTAFGSSIYCPALMSSFQPLSGRAVGKHGLSASGLIGDEVHEWISGELYQFIHDSSDSRQQPLEFMVSTAGKKGGYGQEIYDECVKIRDGVIDVPDTLVVIYAADPDDDWTDEKVWAKANPNLGRSKTLETMRARANEARQLPRLQNDFLCFQLNLWTEQAVRWLPIDALHEDGRPFGWKYCAGPTGWKELEAKLKGKFCYSGIDLSSIVDLSAVVHYFPVQDGLAVPAVLARFYKPATYIEIHGKRDRLPYAAWVKSGALMATPGDVIDYDFIRAAVNADAENFDLRGIGIDRFNATQTTIQMAADGLPIEYFRQGFISMNPPSKILEKAIIAGDIHHGDHPVLSRHIRVVAVETDAADNIKPTKKFSTERIDGVIALVEAIGMAENEDGSDKALTSETIIKRGGLL